MSGRGKAGRLPWPVAAIVLAGACTPAMPPEDAAPRGRFEWSVERYGEGKHHQAIRGFRDFLFREPLHPASDSARYLLGEAYLATEQELLAVNEFEQLANTRPNSPLADDAQMGVCRAYWELSPDLPRDQEYTELTVQACTRLLEFFPRSELVPEAREMVREARQKLAAKDLRTGRWYYDRDLLESAIIYLEAVLRDYPEAEVTPEVLFLLHDAYAQVGFRAEATAVRERLLREFPDTEQAAELRRETEEG